MAACLDSGGACGYDAFSEPIRQPEPFNVTLDATLKSSPAARHQNPAQGSALAVAAVAALTLAGAWFFQLVLDIVPCPLCLEQRYAYYLAVPLGLLVALAAAKRAPRGVVMVGLVLLALAALANAGLGAYHAGVEWGLWQGPTDCTGPMLDLSKGGLLDNLDKVKVVPCDKVQWRFLGLSLAGYNVLISLLMAAIAAWGVVRSRRV
jgi:disulfide bond formation protein DsbB